MDIVKIAEKDAVGARASNAGDRFHELWALRKALSLLEPNPKYQAISVEGVSPEESSPSSGTWSAVDVCLMSGGKSLADADSAEFVQLKYSSTNPNAAWSVARLTSSSAKKGNNSVLRKLAETYEAAETIRGTKNAALSFSLRLVSNQPVGVDVLMALGKSDISDTSAVADVERDKESLRTATGLSKKKFRAFASVLDFSECGAESLFEQEVKSIQVLDQLIEGDSRPWHLELLRLISDAMLPSGSREPITEETLLARLEIGTTSALYPCPNRITPISAVIEREVTRSIADMLVSGTQWLGIHGGAGCGKTTTISQLATMLPLGSMCIQYDCYGSGSYLDDSAPRHRPIEAFTQLSNEIASRLRVPRLLRISERGNSVKAFRERLELGADVLRASNPDALLVIAIDAADNAVAAAERRDEHCFVRELASFTDLPNNVRVVISARTARIAQLELPPTFAFQPIDPFSLDETRAYVRTRIADPDENWVTEFHTLTRGTPRVQAYAFGLSANPDAAIQALLPNGKELSQIFEQAVTTAWQKGGEHGPIAQLCAALIALPRPVPLGELAHAIGSDTTRTTDICEDLSPTLIIKDGVVSFSDEDFEDFVTQRGNGALKQVRATIAEHLLENCNRDAYAARHVVQSLIVAEREQDALRVAMEEPDASLFADPVERRLCHLERMRSALRVCRRTDNAAESLTILLVGAEALRTSDAIARELALNPDLSVRYARDSLERLVLADEKYVEADGPVFCHYMAEDAKNGSFAQAERSRRLFFAWQAERKDRRDYRRHSQQLTTRDIAAFCRAEVASSGFDETRHIFRRLRGDRYAVFEEFAARLLGLQDVDTLEKLLSKPYLTSEIKIRLLCMLAKAGCKIDLDAAISVLSRLQIRRTFSATQGGRRARVGELRECALELCEILVHSGGSVDVVRSVLGDLAQGPRPRWQHVQPANHAQIDALLRAECLLGELDGKPLDVRGLLDIEGTVTNGWHSGSGISYQDHQKQSDITAAISAYLPFYQARAHYVKAAQSDALLGNRKAAWMDRARSATYSESRLGGLGMHYRLAESISSLVALGGERVRDIFAVATELLTARQVIFGSRDADVLRPFSWRSESHGWLTEFAEACQTKITDLRTTSSEKASAFLELSRMLLDCSSATSASLFNAAILVLGDIDINEMRLLGIFDRLASAATGTLDEGTSHSTAVGLASFGTAVAFRLRNYDHFPWSKLSRGITHLSAPVALAAAAHWDDSGLASISEALGVVLQTGVKNGSIPIRNAAACSYLFGRISDRLMLELVRAAASIDEDARLTVHEILAECQALAGTPNPRSSIDAAIVDAVPVERRPRWTQYLAERCEFSRATIESISARAEEIDQSDASHREKVRSFLDGLDWTGSKLDSAASISEFTRGAYAQARDERSLFSIDRELYLRIRAHVPAHQRCEHLSHLRELALATDVGYDVIEALTDAIEAWGPASMAVRDWCTTHLPALISARLMAFMLAMHEKSPLSRLIESQYLTTENLYEALLAGLAERIEEFDATTIYDLVEIIAGLISSRDVGQVLVRYVDRLAARVREADKLDSSDIPRCIDEAFARLLYAYLSDADLAVRWRAAHAVRSLFWLNCANVLDKLVLRYEVVSERSFRAAGFPFYWLAARLWLTIAISRACSDRPRDAVRYARYLFSVLEDGNFPHVLVRALAKQGVLALESSGVLSLTKKQQRLLSAVNDSPLREKRRPRKLNQDDDREVNRASERRFHFDGLDTLRYWYPGMSRLFADTGLIDFVDEAERWIVDRWGITSNPWRWDQETRGEKFRYRQDAMSHSHGGLPTIERFNTHLEWHAMWCAAGEFLKSHPLAKSEFGDEPLQEKIQLATTVAPGLWASDLRSPKPLEERFWIPPREDVNWVEAPSIHEVIDLLCLNDARAWCVVSGDYDRCWFGLRETVNISSCLVSPETAPALLRALQSSRHVHAHYLPRAKEDDDDDDIDISSFKLKGWLYQQEGQTGLDSKDDFANDVSSRVMQPGSAVRKLLKLAPSESFHFGWMRRSTADLVFYSEQWADEISDRRYQERSDHMRSKGERLHCKFYALAEVLRQERCDLLIRVQTYRKKYEERRYSESDQGESAYFNRYVLLTSRGRIKDASGDVGAWNIAG
jgi:hypothetical protein